MFWRPIANRRTLTPWWKFLIGCCTYLTICLESLDPTSRVRPTPCQSIIYSHAYSDFIVSEILVHLGSNLLIFATNDFPFPQFLEHRCRSFQFPIFYQNSSIFRQLLLNESWPKTFRTPDQNYRSSVSFNQFTWIKNVSTFCEWLKSNLTFKSVSWFTYTCISIVLNNLLILPGTRYENVCIFRYAHCTVHDTTQCNRNYLYNQNFL